MVNCNRAHNAIVIYNGLFTTAVAIMQVDVIFSLTKHNFKNYDSMQRKLPVEAKLSLKAK